MHLTSNAPGKLVFKSQKLYMHSEAVSSEWPGVVDQ